jgi:hypothetical protein
MDTFEPEKTIVPIVVASKKDPIQEILGTGCFIGTGRKLHLFTARHIFELGKRDEASKFACVLNTGKGIGIWAISKIVAAQDYDIAICEIAHIEGAVPLRFSQQQPALNSDVVCFEYSRTSIARKPGGGRLVNFQPLAHKGNIMRYFESEYPEKVRTPCFNTSFPALQAPVVRR